jgi:hypothetical protein
MLLPHRIEELKRRAEQGSQQLQGEALEIELESLLRMKFAFDAIELGSRRRINGEMES